MREDVEERILRAIEKLPDEPMTPHDRSERMLSLVLWYVLVFAGALAVACVLRLVYLNLN